MRAKKGFTLVEILIVVVILGILAAIVVPQFTNASTEAKSSSLAADLQTIRSQLELYKIQHNDNLPDCNSQDEFLACMTEKTYASGAAGGNLGPYLPKMPKNPFVDDDGTSDDIAFETTESVTCPSDGSTGWWLNTANGNFFPNDTEPNHATW